MRHQSSHAGYRQRGRGAALSSSKGDMTMDDDGYILDPDDVENVDSHCAAMDRIEWFKDNIRSLARTSSTADLTNPASAFSQMTVALNSLNLKYGHVPSCSAAIAEVRKDMSRVEMAIREGDPTSEIRSRYRPQGASRMAKLQTSAAKLLADAQRYEEGTMQQGGGHRRKRGAFASKSNAHRSMCVAAMSAALVVALSVVSASV